VRGDCPRNSATCTPFDPTDADQYASQQYDEFRQSGFVTLRPHMRIRVVSPVLRPGADPEKAPVSDAEDAQGSTVTLKASDDLLGYQTAAYSLADGGHESVTIKDVDITVRSAAKGADDAQLPRVNYLEKVPPRAYMRLYYQVRRSAKNHSSALLIADSVASLNEASSAFEENQDAFCAAPSPGSRCALFPKHTAVSADIEVFVKKEAIYVPLAAPVSEVLRMAGVADPPGVTSKLHVVRIWDVHPTPVQTKNADALLALPVIGGDRITY
jgi:hypothetical protein